MEAVGAVSSQKVQYGGSWGSVFSKGSVWRQFVSFSDRCTVCSMEVVMGAKLVLQAKVKVSSQKKVLTKYLELTLHALCIRLVN